MYLLSTLRFSCLFFSVLLISTPYSYSFAASVEEANMYKQHGLTREAKLELIEVIFDGSSENSSKAQAYYILGNIAFDENKIAVALNSWRELVNRFPDSPEAKRVRSRINELSTFIGESTRESIENAVASSYLRHGDFWSKGKNRKFSIDPSWIPIVEASIKWYDKVIEEFPKTPASRVAYQEKMNTLLGWTEPGKYGEAYGLNESFTKYMPVLLATFAAFEQDHTNDPTLQAFRYQIAQAYWDNQDWDKTREWLNLIIEKSGDDDTFYKDLAQRRLKKVNY